MEMVKNMYTRFALVLSFLLVFLNLSLVQPQVSFAQNLDQAVTITAIDGEGNKVIETKAVKIDDEDTAWDVLESVADDLNYEEYDFGNMLNGINGVDADWDTYQNFWSFIVNGVPASVGASSYHVTNGDNILFWLTNDMETMTDVSVSVVDAQGIEVIQEENIKVSPYSSAYDAIVQAAENQGVHIDVSVHPEWFTFINNVGDVDLEENQYWDFQINDQSSQIGVLGHQVQPGEHIQLRLQTFDGGDAGDKEEEEDSEVNDSDKSEEDTSDTITEPEPESEEQKEEGPSQELLEQVSEEVDFLANYVLDNNLASAYGDEWWVWALGKSGNSVPSSYLKSVEEKIQENNGEFGNIFDLEKVIIALSSAGIDASNVSGVNLIDKLSEHSSLENPLINQAIYALIAANSGKYNFNEEKESEIIQFILAKEIEGGGWAFFGNVPGVDITGMALIALAPYKDQPEVQEAIDRAVTYLSNEQSENGGFYEEFNGGYSSESAAQVIAGLVSVGNDPTSIKFTKKEGNLVSYLLNFKTSDGLYSHVLEDTNSMAMSTQQAFLAFAYYKNFFEQENPTPSKPDTEEVPKQKENIEQEKVDPKEGNKLQENKVAQKEINKPKSDNDGKTATDQGKKLPKTNTNLFNIIGTGVLVLTAGFIFLVLQRRWRSQ